MVVGAVPAGAVVVTTPPGPVVVDVDAGGKVAEVPESGTSVPPTAPPPPRPTCSPLAVGAAEQAGKRPPGGRLHRGDRAHRDREHGRRRQRDPRPAQRLGRRRAGVSLTARLAAEPAQQPSVGGCQRVAYPAVATAMKMLITPAPARVRRPRTKEATTAPLTAASAPPSRLVTRSSSILTDLGVGVGRRRRRVSVMGSAGWGSSRSLAGRHPNDKLPRPGRLNAHRWANTGATSTLARGPRIEVLG